jgi:hypothetical protein
MYLHIPSALPTRSLEASPRRKHSRHSISLLLRMDVSQPLDGHLVFRRPCICPDPFLPLCPPVATQSLHHWTRLASHVWTPISGRIPRHRGGPSPKPSQMGPASHLGTLARLASGCSPAPMGRTFQETLSPKGGRGRIAMTPLPETADRT